MKVTPNIPIIYEEFPENFVNNVSGWGCFPKEIIEKNKGKLLCLDIDFGDYCTLNCPHCFRKNSRVDFEKRETMDYEKIIEIIREAKKLGLRTVKFLGAGEPLQTERFLEFLQELKKMNITPAIFSKGHVVGDDEEVKRWYSNSGINTGEELAEEIYKTGSSLLLGFNSFDTKLQDKMVGGIEGYTLKRDRALEILVKIGFNKHNPTRLCLAMNPITNDNYNEIFELYKWARVRNLYPIVCPTMISGRCASSEAWHKITPSREKLVELYTKIYKFNIEKGIQTLEQIKEEGISPYAGAHPCNQVACGMYVTLTGIVLRCPGDDITVLGNVWEESLKDIWLKSENYKRVGTFNCGCPPKLGKSIPYGFFEDVMKNLEK